jgi:uncharacterized membrane protein
MSVELVVSKVACMNPVDILLHPATVHVPIGALVAGLCFVCWAYYRHISELEQSAYWLLPFAWLTMIPSLITGTIDAVRHLNDPNTPAEALTWINLHAASAIGLFVLVWRGWQMRRRIRESPAWLAPAFRAYLVNYILILILVTLSGWSGGHMVYTLHLGR